MTRLAVVTGGTQGMGAEIAKTFKTAGYKVASIYLKDDDSVLEFKRETGIEVFNWDVSDYAACEAGIKKVEDSFGQHVGILVNNAGITRDAMFHKSTFENWELVLRNNLFSCYTMSHCVIGKMRDNNFGRIISMSSVNALAGQLGQTNYCASKAGIIGFTKALALESAAKGITVNAIAPGYINTNMVSALGEEIIKAIIEKTPVKRLGQTQDVARAVLFLASDDAGYITGETISVNGGLYMK